MQTVSSTGERPVAIDQILNKEEKMKKFFKIFKKPKFWIILLITIVFVILCGSFASQIMSYVADFFGTIWRWIASALRWLAGVLNFFDWNGMLG